MSDIAELLERVKAATSANGFLDRSIHTALLPDEVIVRLDGVPTTPRYTASIDAALALVEKMLPGVAVSLDGLVGPEQRAVHHHPANKPSKALDALVDAAVRRVESQRWSCELHWFINPAWRTRGDAPTPPLAILAALLTALTPTVQP